MSFTRKDIRQRITAPGFCNDGFVSSATGGTAATLIDTTRKEPDSAFNFGQVVIITGTAALDRRYVASWTNSTATAVPDRNFSAAIASGNQYEMHRQWSADEKDTAINEAIRMASDRWARRVEDTSLTLASATYTYALASLTIPLDPDWLIDEVWYDTGNTGTGFPYQKIDDDFWSVRNNDGTLTLQLVWIPRATATLRLVYRVRPSIFSADTDTLKPDATNFYNFVCAKATAILFDKMALKGSQDANEHWQTEAQKMHQLAEAYYGLDKPQAQPSTVKFGLWGIADDNASVIRYGEN